jgi:hypothetical protein
MAVYELIHVFFVYTLSIAQVTCYLAVTVNATF